MHPAACWTEDAYREWEFHNIIGKEYIDGEVHYLVDWVPNLVRDSYITEGKSTRWKWKCWGSMTTTTIARLIDSISNVGQIDDFPDSCCTKCVLEVSDSNSERIRTLKYYVEWILWSSLGLK